MTQLTDYPPPPAAPAPPKKKRPYWVVGLVVVVAGLAALGSEEDTKSGDGGGSFYASAGWTVDRVANFEVDLERDAGWSEARVECAAKDVAGTFSWYVWSGMSHTGKLTAAEMADC